VIESLICPSNPADSWPYSSYAGCHHDAEAPIDVNNRGVFFLNSRITRDDLKDGAAYTLFLGEKLIDSFDLGWLSGTPGTLRNTGTRLRRSDNSTWGPTLDWLYSYPSNDSQWQWGDQVVDPLTGEIMTVDPTTGEVLAPVEPTDPPTEEAATDDAMPAEPSATEEPSAPPSDAEGASAPESIESSKPDVLDAAPLEDAVAELGVTDQELKPDANGLLPHSRFGGNPRAPLAVGGFSARHHGGVNFAFGDGSVRFIAQDASAGLLGRLANREDGQIVDAKEW
jgi:prepilin-type processing-associated H-X9-DG protein